MAANIKARGGGYKDFWRNHGGFGVIGCKEFSQQFLRFVQADGAVVVPPQKLSLPHFQHRKAYQFPFGKVGDVVPIFWVKVLHYVLASENPQSCDSVPQSGCLFKL